MTAADQELDTTNLTVFQALNLAMREVTAVGKTGKNLEQHYNFRGIDAVVNAAGPAFRRVGIIVSPVQSEARYRDVQTSRGKPSRECTVDVTYRFYGPMGDFLDAVVPGESMDSGDKGTAKAMSVAYRIALLQVLCIPTDDPDPDQSSYERDYYQEPAAAPPAAPPPPPETLEQELGRVRAQREAMNARREGPPLAQARAREWTAICAVYPQWKQDELMEETGKMFQALGTTSATATADQWTTLAEELETQVDEQITRRHADG